MVRSFLWGSTVSSSPLWASGSTGWCWLCRWRPCADPGSTCFCGLCVGYCWGWPGHSCWWWSPQRRWPAFAGQISASLRPSHLCHQWNSNFCSRKTFFWLNIFKNHKIDFKRTRWKKQQQNRVIRGFPWLPPLAELPCLQFSPSKFPHDFIRLQSLCSPSNGERCPIVRSVINPLLLVIFSFHEVIQ